MDAATLSTMLNGPSFLEGLSAETLAKVAALARIVEFATGETIFREGRENETLYFLQSGRVALDMTIPLRGSVRILSLGPGDLLAWSAMIGDPQAMTATATALEPTRAVALPRTPLQALCDADPEFGYRFLRQVATALSKRLLATRLQLLDLFADASVA